MSPDTPYRFYEVWTPRKGIFAPEATRWTTILGAFIAPIVAKHPSLVYWFVQEGPWFQFCYASDMPKLVEGTVRCQVKKVGLKVKRILRGDVGGALGGTRWVSQEGLKDKALEMERSVRMLKACHGVCHLLLHALTRQGRYWVIEVPCDTKQNPFGNLFESFIHLVANLTGARFDVKVTAQTRWMHGGPSEARLECRL